MSAVRRFMQFLSEINPPTAAELVWAVAIGAPVLTLILCLVSAMMLPDSAA